jgi:hypothetical protein
VKPQLEQLVPCIPSLCSLHSLHSKKTTGSHYGLRRERGGAPRVRKRARVSESVRACSVSYEEEDTCVVYMSLYGHVACPMRRRISLSIYTSLFGRVRPGSECKCILYGAFPNLKVKLRSSTLLLLLLLPLLLLLLPLRLPNPPSLLWLAHMHTRP